MNFELKQGFEEVRISFHLVGTEWASAKLSESPETSSSFPRGHFLGHLYEGIKMWLGELQW